MAQSQHTNELNVIRALLMNKEYGEARERLLRIQHDPTAQKWLAHLDKIAPPTNGRAAQSAPAKVATKKKRPFFLRWNVLVAIALAAFMINGWIEMENHRRAQLETVRREIPEILRVFSKHCASLYLVSIEAGKLCDDRAYRGLEVCLSGVQDMQQVAACQEQFLATDCAIKQELGYSEGEICQELNISP